MNETHQIIPTCFCLLLAALFFAVGAHFGVQHKVREYCRNTVKCGLKKYKTRGKLNGVENMKTNQCNAFIRELYCSVKQLDRRMTKSLFSFPCGTHRPSARPPRSSPLDARGSSDCERRSSRSSSRSMSDTVIPRRSLTTVSLPRPVAIH